MKNKAIFICTVLYFALQSITIAQTVSASFEGIQYSGEKPPDPVIAVGENHVVLAVNSKYEIYNKSGTYISGQSFSDFFSSVSPQPTGSIFDPKIAYDHYSDRYILLAIDGSHRTRYLLAVSSTDDPTETWYKYSIQGTLYDLDYPGLGFDENTIVLTSQSEVGSNSYSPDLTILNKQEIYSNSKNYQIDIRDINNGEKLKPVRVMGTSPSKFHLVNTTSDGKVRIWSISNPLGGSPSLSIDKTITFASFQGPQNAVQKGESEKIEINTVGSSISDVVCKDGIIYGAYTVANTSGTGSSVKYFSTDINNNFAILDEGLIQSTDTYYYYPVVHPDGSGNMILVFNKSSSNDYVGVAYTIHIKNNTSYEPINWLKQGAAGYKLLLNTKNRWGDYSGIAMDPENNYRIWIYGEWAKTSTTWSTWVGSIEINIDISTQFSNIIGTQNAGGTLTVNSTTTVNSGNTLSVPLGNNNVKTNNERFSNWNSSGYTYKNNNWNDAASELFLSHDFYAQLGSQQEQDAKYLKMNYAKIQVKTDGYTLSGTGDINFQDPWYVKSDGSQPGDFWLTETSPYEPTGKAGETEKGVFLDQNPQFQPGLPNYSVKADQTQENVSINGSNHNMYFQNWEAINSSLQYPDELETPVVFNYANAVVTANYKVDNLTNSSETYTNNGQRRIAQTANDYIHKVYESMGKVWYEKSTDKGDTWTIMNNGMPLTAGNSKSPCIAVNDANPDCEVIIAYQKENSGGGSDLELNVFFSTNRRILIRGLLN